MSKFALTLNEFVRGKRAIYNLVINGEDQFALFAERIESSKNVSHKRAIKY